MSHRRIIHPDGREETPLAFELSHTLPPVDPENGDDLTVTDSLETVRPLIHDLLTIIPENQQKGFHRAPVDNPTSTLDRMDKVIEKFVTAHEDFAFIVRQRKGRVHQVAAAVRLDPQTIRWNLLVGAILGSVTVRRALWDIGIRRRLGTFREDTPAIRTKMASIGTQVALSDKEIDRLDTIAEMGEERP